MRLYRELQRIDRAGKLDQQTVARGADQPTLELRDLWIDHFGAQCL
ncbi:hypothetical protein X738_31570 [Mesorhizobium sp. LNHC209A00]|nr:hypothetical protein X738_31570 [Mesorhizobium sp. LNHC209A00]